MKEKIISIGLITHKSLMEPISKFFLDSESFEIVPLRDIFDVDLKSMDSNPYEDFLRTVHSLYLEVGKTPKPAVSSISLPAVFNDREFREFANGLKEEMDKIDSEIARIESEISDLDDKIEAVEAVKDYKGSVKDLKEMELITLKVGKIHLGYFDRFVESVKDLDVIVEKVKDQDRVVTCVVAYPTSMEGEMEKVFRTVSFKELELPDSEADPVETLYELKDEKKSLKLEIEELNLRKRELFYKNRRNIYRYYDLVFVLKNVYDVVMRSGMTEEFFAIVGWITENALKDLKEFVGDYDDVLLFEDVDIPIQKPTKLRNPGFFKHFEFLVKMYGVPKSDEIDPTPIVSILFLFFYGFMFGDIGHGLTISAISWLLYAKTKIDLWYAMGFAGLSSALFGLFYGSIFGFEIISPLIARPLDNINSFLEVSIVIGAGLIIFGMILNLINRMIRKEYGKMIFDPNGISGLGLYTSALAGTVLYIQSGRFPMYLTLAALGSLAMVFLYFIIFEEGSLGERFVLAVFETFDRIIMFFSNTLSFIRLGAFAMNHAGLFLAFYIMAQMSKSGAGAFTSLLVGNLLIIFLEGLVVFIQAVRLEFYEFFSKFYEGDGREFNPIRYRGPEGGVY